MKTSIVILIGAIGLAGCTTMGFHRTGHENDGYPYTYSGTPESPPPSTYSKPNADPYVRDLPEKAQDILNAAGIKDMVVVATVDKNGRIRLLKPSNVKYVKSQFPMMAILPPTPITIQLYEGSRCVLWSDGSRSEGPDKASGESGVAGGMRIDGIFCLCEKREDCPGL